MSSTQTDTSGGTQRRRVNAAASSSKAPPLLPLPVTEGGPEASTTSADTQGRPTIGPAKFVPGGLDQQPDPTAPTFANAQKVAQALGAVPTDVAKAAINHQAVKTTMGALVPDYVGENSQHMVTEIVKHGQVYLWNNKGKFFTLATGFLGTNLLSVIAAFNGLYNNPFGGPAKPASPQTSYIFSTQTVAGPTVTAAPVTHTVTQQHTTTTTDPGQTVTRTLIDPASTATVTHTVTAPVQPGIAAESTASPNEVD